MKQQIPLTAFLLILFLSLMCTAQESTKATPAATAQAADGWEDQSTVEKALILGHIAMEMRENGPPIDRVIYGTNERTRKYIEVNSNAARAREALRDALLKHFGEGSPKVFQISSYRDTAVSAADLKGMLSGMAQMGDPFQKQLPLLKIKIDGDKADIRNPKLPVEILHAVRQNGKWKIELQDFGPALDYELTLTPLYEAGTDIMRDLAREIADGKYKSSDEAFAAFTERGQQLQKKFEVLRPKFDQLTSPATRPAN